MQLLAEIARGAYETVRETLPSDEREAGVFLAGMTWAFLLFILMLVVMSYLTLRTLGQPV